MTQADEFFAQLGAQRPARTPPARPVYRAAGDAAPMPPEGKGQSAPSGDARCRARRRILVALAFPALTAIVAVPWFGSWGQSATPPDVQPAHGSPTSHRLVQAPPVALRVRWVGGRRGKGRRAHLRRQSMASRRPRQLHRSSRRRARTGAWAREHRRGGNRCFRVVRGIPACRHDHQRRPWPLSVGRGARPWCRAQASAPLLRPRGQEAAGCADTDTRGSGRRRGSHGACRAGSRRGESFYEVKRQRVAELLRAIIGFRSIEVLDAPLLLRVLEIYEVDRIDFADAYLVANAETSGVGAVASFDRSIDRVGTVERIEPA